MMAERAVELLSAWCMGAVAAVILGRVFVQRRETAAAKDHRREDFGPGHFAIVILGAPTRGMSVTVIWNRRYSNWKASRFQRANGPLVFTA